MPGRLSLERIRKAAAAHELDVDALRAVIRVESGGRGFLDDGRPKILLEGHILWRRLQARGISPYPLSTYYPSVCYPEWTKKYYLGGPQEYDRVAKVVAFGEQAEATSGMVRALSFEKAAWESCSWGLFQLLGMNYQAAGYENVLALKADHEKSEAAHLNAILRWMKGNGLLDRLREKNWPAFARGYNGPGQAEKYAGKLKLAYASYKEERRPI